MDKQKLVSFAFGITGLDLDKLLEGLGISEKLERQEIQKAVNDFEKYILARHGDNPSYDGIARFWKENQVFEELVRIRYSLDSRYKSYEKFKDFLSEKDRPQDFNDSLSSELMDELNVYLTIAVQKASNMSQSDLGAHSEMHEKTRDILSELSEQSNEHYQELLQMIIRTESGDTSPKDGKLPPSQYYNLFVSSEEGIYDKSPFIIYNDRVLQKPYTTNAVIDKFSNFTLDDINEIIALPTLFLPEYRNEENEKEKVGYLGQLIDIDIAPGPGKSEFYFVKKQEFPMRKIVQLMNDLKFRNSELERTHWAIKKADLLEVIKKLFCTENYSEFNKEMKSFKQILESKGYILESEHKYVYRMQDSNAFDDVKEWLEQNGYKGDLDALFCSGKFFRGVGVVYGLFDMSIISHDSIHKLLEKEALEQRRDLY